MLEISGPAISQSNLELVTLAELKQLIKVAATDQDTRLQLILDQIHYDVHRYTGRVLKSTGTSWVFALEGSGDQLYLPQWPIVSVASVKIGYIQDSSLTWYTAIDLPSTDYYADKKNGVLRLVTGAYWPQQDNSVRVEYTAGYASGSYPQDLRNAIMEWAGVKWKRALDGRWDVSGDGKEMKTNSYRVSEIPERAREVLDRYRRLEMSFG